MRFYAYFKKETLAGILLAVLLFPAVSYADVTSRDIEIFAKAVGFVEGGPKGNVPVAIVYNGTEASSYADAKKALGLMNDYSHGKSRFAGHLVPMGQPVNMPIAFIMRGAEKVASSLTRRKIITVASDPACVIAGKCVMAVQSEPKIDIFVSQAASKDAGVRFGAAFLMVVKEY